MATKPPCKGANPWWLKAKGAGRIATRNPTTTRCCSAKTDKRRKYGSRARSAFSCSANNRKLRETLSLDERETAVGRSPYSSSGLTLVILKYHTNIWNALRSSNQHAVSIAVETVSSLYGVPVSSQDALAPSESANQREQR